MIPQLFLAFDGLKKMPLQALADISSLSESGESFGIKFNLDYMLNPDTDLALIIKTLKVFHLPLFADLKMWNGSQTMEVIVETFVGFGVDFVNVYALADKQMEKAVKATRGSNTKILGLTVLSHYDDAYCQKWFRRTVAESVTDFSRFAIEAGCHGIILPGTMLDVVKDLNTIKMVTGVRPEWYKDDRHEQEATPVQVSRGGAHFAVCGSPILKQPSKEQKIAALRNVLAELAG